MTAKKKSVKKNVSQASLENLKPNVNGRTKGIPNKATVYKEAIKVINGEATDEDKKGLMITIKTYAAQGDSTCIKILSDLWLPVPPSRKGARFLVDIPTEINNPVQLNEFINKILTLVSTGEISLEEAQLLYALSDRKAKAIELIVADALSDTIKNHDK